MPRIRKTRLERTTVERTLYFLSLSLIILPLTTVYNPLFELKLCFPGNYKSCCLASLKESLRGTRPRNSNHSKLHSLPKVDGSISSVSNGIRTL